MIDLMKRNLIKALGLDIVSGCAGAQPISRSLTTLSYNYTGRYIGDVVVDGAWTGGADAYGMGGGAQGLLAPSDRNRQVILKVSWVVADDYDVATNTYTRRPDEQKQAVVEVARPYPKNPSYLILHFYPDGHVEAEMEADRPKRRIPPPVGYHR